jgi:hypothetical protein
MKTQSVTQPHLRMAIFKDLLDWKAYPGDDVVSSLPQPTLSSIALADDSESPDSGRPLVQVGSMYCL